MERYCVLALAYFMLPDNTIACFDSTGTNAPEIAKFLGDTFNPLAIAKHLRLL